MSVKIFRIKIFGHPRVCGVQVSSVWLGVLGIFFTVPIQPCPASDPFELLESRMPMVDLPKPKFGEDQPVNATDIRVQSITLSHTHTHTHTHFSFFACGRLMELKTSATRH